MGWAEYWDADSTVYSSQCHKQVHYERVARDIVRHIRTRDAIVVDYGCGEALSAHVVANACRHLYLCESSATTRARLSKRNAQRSNIGVISVAEFEGLGDASVDLIVANSVVQYLSLAELEHLLRVSRAKLAPSGQLVLADIIPRDVGVLTDAAQLLGFARENGFLLSATVGLARSFFSSYRKVRAALGLLRFEEAGFVTVLGRAGFSARRHYPNIGHNTKRMTFVASPTPGA